MKKYLLSVMTFCLGMAMPAQAATSDISSLDNTVYVESVSMPAGMVHNLVKHEECRGHLWFWFRFGFARGI